MNFKYFLSLISVTLILSCGTTHTVISDDGKVYEVRGDTFLNNGKDVTETLSSDEKKSIKSNLGDRLNGKKIADEQREQLEDQQKELEKAQDEARKKQRDLEKKQQEIEDRLKEKEDARNDFIKAKDQLKRKQKRFQRLKDKGKLSPNDIVDWEDRLKGYQEDVDKAEKKLNSLK
jgi:chromosome segregation ATPase